MYFLNGLVLMFIIYTIKYKKDLPEKDVEKVTPIFFIIIGIMLLLMLVKIFL